MTDTEDAPLDAPCSACGGPVQVSAYSTEENMVQVECLNPECGLPDLRLNPRGSLATWQRAEATAQAYGYNVSSPARTADEAVQKLTDMIAAGMLQQQGVPPEAVRAFRAAKDEVRSQFKPKGIVGFLKMLGRTALYVVIFHVLIVGSLALGRAIGLGDLLFYVVSLLLLIGIARLFTSLFGGDPIVLARDPALWLAVAVMIALMLL